MRTIRLSILTASLFLVSCQSYNNAVTPKAKVITDDFDGSKIVTQSPISSASKLSEPWHLLGFDYTSKTPNTFYLTAVTQGIDNVFGLEFNADGKFIKTTRVSSTEIKLAQLGNKSQSRFSIPYADFVTIANASSVKMKIVKAHNYSVSSFGTSTGALVGSKFQPFLEKVSSLR